jgi:hypothetical protein
MQYERLERAAAHELARTQSRSSLQEQGLISLSGLEVKKLLDQAYAEAKNILREHRCQLDLVAGELLERETLDGKSFKRLLQQEGPQSRDETSPGASSSVVNSKLEVETTKAKKAVASRDMIETK